MAELTYALNKEGQLLHIDSVANGYACDCRCPGCGAPLIAKNNGEMIVPHFAHASGKTCEGALESELHLLAKEIINEEKAVMLPSYGNVYSGGLVKFDDVEVEKRNDVKSLQPDLCGVVHSKKTGKESRLWIEIRVTHAIGSEKRVMIQKEGISCVEINLGRFIDVNVTKDQIREFLLNNQKEREWTNNPVLEAKRLSATDNKRKLAQESLANKRLEQMDAWDAKAEIKRFEKEYLDRHKDCCIVGNKSCYICKHHTTRQALFEECKRLHFPVWVREALSSNLLYWTIENVRSVVEPSVNINTKIEKGYRIQYDSFLHLLPTSSPNIHGMPVTVREIRQNQKIIPFLLDTVPAIIASEGI